MKRILIAGAGSSIAQSLCTTLDQRNDISLTLIGHNQEKLDILKQKIKHVENLICCDFSHPELLENELTAVFNSGLSFDGFVYCAGLTRIESIKKLNYNSNMVLMNINYFSFVELIRLLLKDKKRKNQLRIAVISSASAAGRTPYTAAYCASKAAMNAFIKSASMELVKFNCVINAVCPTYVDTPMLEYNYLVDPNFKEHVKRYQPLGLIYPEAVAEELAYLLLKDYSCETGTIRFINGGNII